MQRSVTLSAHEQFVLELTKGRPLRLSEIQRLQDVNGLKELTTPRLLQIQQKLGLKKTPEQKAQARSRKS